MGLLKFANNAEAVLSAACDAVETFLQIGAGRELFPPLQNSALNNEFQYATLYSPDDPDTVEIVAIMLHDVVAGLGFEVFRGVDGTTPRAWPAGARISARLNAAVMDGLVQNASGYPGSGVVAIPSSTQNANHMAAEGFSVFTTSRNIEKAWVIGGYPVLQLREGAGGSGYLEPAMTSEAVMTTFSMDLGEVPAWQPNWDYLHGDVIRPTVPNGKQFHLCVDNAGGAQSDATEPSFAGDAASADVFPLESTGAIWHAGTSLSGGQIFGANFPANVKFFPSEFGFICRKMEAGSAPSVSIGSVVGGVVDNATRYADNAVLTDITAAHTRHRFLVTSPLGVDGFVVTLNTPATGGSVLGRFYAKGIFAQTHE